MANEATLVWRLQDAIPFTVSNTTGIEKGAVLKMSDPMTAATTTAAADIIAGIAASEKVANDGKTTLGVYRKGIFKMTLSGACVVGDILGTDAVANMVKKVTNVSGCKVLGYALETGASGETIMVELNIGANGQS